MRQTIWYNINGIKVDLILHEYPYLNPVEDIDGIRFLSIQDIIPMKLGAVSCRGAKKDFWDIAFLLDNYSIKEMIDLYKRKYTTDDIGLVILSFTYFDDAESQSDPVALKNLSWTAVKRKIENAVRVYFEEQ